MLTISQSMANSGLKSFGGKYNDFENLYFANRAKTTQNKLYKME